MNAVIRVVKQSRKLVYELIKTKQHFAGNNLAVFIMSLSWGAHGVMFKSQKSESNLNRIT